MERKKSLTVVVCIGLVLMLASMLVLPAQGAAQTKGGKAKTLKIGVLASLSGWFSGYDTAQWGECQAVAEIWNEKGGLKIKGEQYKIELLVEDNKSTLDGVTASCNKLIFDDGVKFLAGPAAFFALAATAVCEPAKVLRVLGYATCQPGEVDAKTPYAFLGKSGTMEHGRAALTYMKQLYPNVKKVVFLHPDDGAIPYLNDRVKKMLAGGGIEMLGDTIGFNNETEDFSPIAAKVLERKPDAVFVINGLAQHYGALLKLLRSGGWNKPYCAGGSISALEILTIAGKAAATDFFSATFLPGNPGNPPAMEQVAKKLIKPGEERALHLETPNGLWCLLYAIQDAQSLDPTEVRNHWEKMDTIPGTLWGIGKIGGKETYGIRHIVATPVPYSRLMNGKLVFGRCVETISP
jgi:ABC-type branched-subunit amino acid transport system substrate-binding protein